jgi:hypothetical protein
MTRKKRVSKGNWSTDSHSIFGDKGQIFRVAQSGIRRQLHWPVALLHYKSHY